MKYLTIYKKRTYSFMIYLISPVKPNQIKNAQDDPYAIDELGHELVVATGITTFHHFGSFHGDFLQDAHGFLLREFRHLSVSLFEKL